MLSFVFVRWVTPHIIPLLFPGLFGDTLKMISQMMMSWAGSAVDFLSYGLIDALYHVIPLLNPKMEDFSSNFHALQVRCRFCMVCSEVFRYAFQKTLRSQIQQSMVTHLAQRELDDLLVAL